MVKANPGQLLSEVFTELVDAGVRTHLEELGEQAERLGDAKTPDVDEIAELRRGYVSLYGSAGSFMASDETKRDILAQLVDHTFGLTVNAGAQLLTEAGNDDDLNTLFAPNGMDTLVGLMEGQNGTIEQKVERGTSSGRARKERPARKGRSTNSEGTTRHRNHATLEKYIPDERRVVDAEYKGFTVTELREMVGYGSVQSAGIQIIRIRNEQGDQYLKPIVENKSGSTYDFRKVACRFIRTKVQGGGSAIYTKSRAMKAIAAVLTLEGVQTQYIEKDVEGILKTIESDVPDLKNGKEYSGRKLSDNFVQAAQKFYKLSK